MTKNLFNITSVLHSAPGRIVVLLMAILAGILAGYMLALLVTGLFPPRSPAALILEMLILVTVVTIFYLGAARWFELRRLPVDELALPGAGWELGAGLPLGAGLFALVAGVLWLLGIYRPGGWNGLSVLIPALAATLPSAFLQELAFRGVILRISEESFGTFTALLVSSLVPGLLRAANDGATPLGIFSAALIAGGLGTAYLLTRRLWLPIGLHIAWDLASNGIFGVGTAMVDNEPVRGLLHAALSGPELLTGGAAGVEASVVSLVIVTIACALIGVMAWKKWRYE